MKRNSDGTFRGPRQPRVMSESTQRARWIETETLQLNQMRLSLRAIADQITLIGSGEAQPLNPVPAVITFPADYSISHEAVAKRIRQALARAPALAAEELRKIDHARAEEVFLNLQPMIRRGSLRAVEGRTQGARPLRPGKRLRRSQAARADRQRRQASHPGPTARSGRTAR